MGKQTETDECSSKNQEVNKVFNSEISNFSQDQGNREPAPKVWDWVTLACEEIKGLGVPPHGREQPIPQIDTEIAKPGTRLEEVGLSAALLPKKKGYFRIEN